MSENPIDAQLRHAANVHTSGDLQQAGLLYDAILSSHPNNADTLHLRGLVEHQLGNQQASQNYLSRAIEQSPQNAEYLNNLGAVFLAQNLLNDASSRFQAAIRIKPDYPEAHFNLGLIFTRQHQWQQAIPHLDQAVKLKSDYADAHYNLARACDRIGRQQKAAHHYRIAIEQTPSHAAYHYAYGVHLSRVGNQAAAEGAFQRVLELHPNSAEAHNGLGTILISRKRTAEAIDEFQKALQINPNYADAQSNLGLAMLESRQSGDAIARLQKAVEIQPENLVFQVNLAKGFLVIGQQSTARDVCLKVIERQPEFDKPWRVLAEIYVALNLERDAITALESVVKIAPFDADAYRWLAELYEQVNDSDSAIEACRKILALEPNHKSAHFQLGRLLNRVAQAGPRQRRMLPEVRACHEEALLHLKRAVDLDPTAETYETLGTAYYNLDQHEQAIDCFEESIRLDPQYGRGHDSLGNSLLEHGDIPAAVEHFEKAVACDPQLGIAHFHLSRARKSDNPQATIKQLEELLSREDLHRQQQIFMQFALARVHDDARDYDRAFENYIKANELKSRPRNGSRQDDEYINDVIEIFDADFIREHSQAAVDSHRPIFVIGVPRSGTTLTEQIISSHPDVFGAGELKDIAYFTHRIGLESDSPFRFPKAVKSISESALVTMAGEYDRLLAKISGNAPRVVDKMPTNFVYLGLIAMLFPNATIVHCRRHPLDTCVSCFRQNLDWPFCDLAELGRYYKRYDRLMAHWNDVLPMPIHEVRYEQMVSDHDQSIRSLIDFCDLSWDNACLEYYNNDRAVGTPSKWQVRQPIYSSSVGSWKRYAAHLEPMIETMGTDLVPDWTEALEAAAT